VSRPPERVIDPAATKRPILSCVSAATDLDNARYAHMRWNTPLSSDHAEMLLDRLELDSVESVLDLGCGWGELLLQAVDAGDTVDGHQITAIGVDIDGAALARGRGLARARGKESQVSFIRGAAEGWNGEADRVLCIGAAHAFGGTAAALSALPQHIRPGGRLLYGDGCWERPPTAAATALFAEVLELHEIVRHALNAGWRLLHLSTADQREWDDFESSWRSGREEWLLAHPGEPEAGPVRDELDTRIIEYAGAYRGVLGFCYLVLA
jgi:SAM-dependent methyltransferase